MGVFQQDDRRTKDDVIMKEIDYPKINNKTILLRVDLNSEVVDGKVQDSPRIRAAAESIRKIISENKIVILAHQGRKGEDDFTDLSQHAKLLSKYLPKEVEFIDDIYGGRAKEEIKEMNEGEVLLLDNVRLLDEETEEKSAKAHANSSFVKSLSSVCDIFINDAFSVCHRSHASMMGFTQTLPSYPGPRLKKEINSLDELKNAKHEIIYILGGNKPKDAINIITRSIGFNIDFVLAGGVIGELFLKSKGAEFGAKDSFLRKHSDILDKFKTELENHKDNIILPKDFAIEDSDRKEVALNDLPVEKNTMDIGEKTIQEFKKYIENAKTIVMNGTLGVNEKEEFRKGTLEILNAIKNTEAMSVIGGGDTSKAMDDMGFDMLDFSHVSLAGGAFVSYISGETLPALEALENSA